MRVEVIVGPEVKVAPGPVRDLVKAVLDADGASGSVVVAFVDEQEMSRLNARFRALEGSTDVLSFRQADAEPGWPEPEKRAKAGLGEVVVCPEVVARYALEEGGDRDTQLGRTILHGVLHLLGYDHEEDSGEMLAREEALMTRLAPEVGALSQEHGK